MHPGYLVKTSLFKRHVRIKGQKIVLIPSIFLRSLFGVPVFVALTSLAVVQSANGQSTFDVTVLAGSCANCHGTDGRSPGGIPSLAGRPAHLLKAQMLAFQSDPPVGTTIMNRLAKGYSDFEIDALATYFSQLPTQAPPLSPASLGAQQ
jgi:cytochrome subunit of sulfide dehydrogenase